MTQPLLKEGLCPAASDAFRKAGVTAERIGQTIGNAPASAGTHASDGKINGLPYCAATDLRVRDLTDDDMKALADKLASVGFAVFIRRPGHDHWPSSEVRHIHVVYAGVDMKPTLRHQVHDFCHSPMLNGLASHAPYTFWKPQQASVQVVRTLFLAHNPAQG